MPDGVMFIPFAFVEAAANLLTNPALDPFGKIPEFKFCAAKVEATDPQAGSPRSKRFGSYQRGNRHSSPAREGRERPSQRQRCKTTPCNIRAWTKSPTPSAC